MFLSDKIDINKSSRQDVIQQRIWGEFIGGIVEPSAMMRPVVVTAAEPGADRSHCQPRSGLQRGQGDHQLVVPLFRLAKLMEPLNKYTELGKLGQHNPER